MTSYDQFLLALSAVALTRSFDISLAKFVFTGQAKVTEAQNW